MTNPLTAFFSGRPPLSAGAIQIFAGLAIFVAGVVVLKVTVNDYYWILVVLGLALAIKGGIAESLTGERDEK